MIIPLNEPIVLKRYRVINPANNEEIPEGEITLNEIKVVFQDLQNAKTIFAIIAGIPKPIPLLFGDAYEKYKANPNETELENKFKSFIPENPATLKNSLQKLMPRTLDSDPDGPGTILAGMFGAMGIKSAPNCSCKAHAIRMNAEGNDWCEANIGTILDWLRQEATKRKLPFIEAAAKAMVKKSIAKSRRLLAKKQQ